MEQLWHGFRMEEFIFEGKNACLVFPEEGKAIGRLALKTVYWDAFPEAVELDLVKKGFHLCFVANDHRWGAAADIERMARFVKTLTKKYGLQKRIVPVGMSCGGLMAVQLAVKHPELISCLYLDAPVMNYLSCPACLGDAKRENVQVVVDEVLRALEMSSISELLCYRQMPIDGIPVLIQNHIPVVLVAGLADLIVPYHENGKYLQMAYEASQVDFVCYLKPGCDHHPHGLTENEEVIAFILAH
jgi:pimeloyl-ACP methyl ester carboxylesterase